MNAEKLYTMPDEAVVFLATCELQARSERFKSSNFDRITVVRGHDEVAVIFEMSVRFIPQYHDEFEHSYAAEVEYMDDECSIMLMDDLYVPDETSREVCRTVHESKVVAMGPEDSASVFERAETYEIVVSRAHAHGSDMFVMDKSSGQIMKTGGEHYEDEVHADSDEEFVPPQGEDVALDEILAGKDTVAGELRWFPQDLEPTVKPALK